MITWWCRCTARLRESCQSGRRPRSSTSTAGIPTRVELLDVSDEPHWLRVRAVRHPELGELPTLAEWRSAHDAALASASRSVATSATRLAAEAAAAREARRRNFASPTDRTPAWPRVRGTSTCRRGRRGATAVRSAAPFTVRCRRSTSRAEPGLAAACAAQAAAEGVLGKENVIEALAQAAIDSGHRENGGHASSLARGLRRNPLRRRCTRGVHRPVVRGRRRSRRRRLQDRRLAKSPPTSTRRSNGTACSCVRTPRRCVRSLGGRFCGRCFCF